MATRSEPRWSAAPWFLTRPAEIPARIAPRRRLIAALDEHSSQPVTVVSAPSGFGKTVLLSQWVSATSSSTAWLTLTPHDSDDRSLLLSGILAAVTRRTTSDDEPVPMYGIDDALLPDDQRRIIGRIAARIQSSPSPTVVVIDDAHLAGPHLSTGPLELLHRVTDGALRFIVAGTPELLSWFAPAVVRETAAVLTADDLRMTALEIADDAAACGQPEDDATIEQLRHATGGWPIAVRLHHLSRGDRGLAPPGTDERLSAYIEHHVLTQLGVDMRTFVLAATTCGRLDSGLASALTDQHDAAEMLEQCLRLGLPLERVSDGDGRTVYRWHDAFAAACRNVVARHSPMTSRDLHTRAANTLADVYPAEALTHAAQTHDVELMSSILRRSWLRILIESGGRNLNAACLRLPALQGDDATIQMIRACCLNLSGDRSGSLLLAESARSRGSSDPAWPSIETFARLILADEYAELARAADDARSLLQSGAADPGLLPYCIFLLGWTELRLRRQPSYAADLLRTARNEARAARRAVLAHRAGSNLLFALAYGGHLDRAVQLATELDTTDELADDWQHYDGGIGLFALAFTHFWRNDLESSAAILTRVLRDGGHHESYTALARVFLAFIAAAQADTPAVRAAHELVEGIARTEAHGVPWHQYRTVARASLLSAEGLHDAALHRIAPARDWANVPVVRVVAAEIARLADQHSLAMQMLGGLSPAERSISYIGASAGVTAALIAQERGDHARARTRLERALDAASAEGVLRPFVSRDPRLAELLADHAIAGTAHQDMIATLLAKNPSRDASTAGVPLSTREAEIFGYLCTPLTAQEIADALFVSVNTVRTHQRAIYRKLGVTSRRDAVHLRLRAQ